MKSPIYFFAFLIVALTIFKTTESKMTIEQIKNTLKPFKNSCLKKVSIDTELVDGTTKGNFPDEQSLKCFFKCFLAMMKVVKGNEIILTGMMAQIDIMMQDEYVDRMKNICTTCYEQATSMVQNDGCELSYQFAKCFYETDKDLYFFF